MAVRKPVKEQVRAWLYVVVAPVADGLRRELFFLDRRDPTWRYRAKRCEFIRPIREYVDATQESTLGQFLRFFPEIEKLAKAHDSQLAALERAAEEAHRALATLPEFLATTSTS